MRERVLSSPLPAHVAIIMDGNGRWAKKRNLPRTAGHKMGIESLKKIVDACGQAGIPYLTVYAFSTENWKRPQEEVTILMNLIIEYIRRELETLHNNGVRVNPIGDWQKLPAKTLEEIEKAREKTRENQRLVLNVALNYGARLEITEAVRKIAWDVKNNLLDPSDITEEILEKALYTGGQPDPDLIIRPSGEKRLSNFLLWQAAYSEFWFSDVLWPDFTENHLWEAILEYQNRERRFGSIS